MVIRPFMTEEEEAALHPEAAAAAAHRQSLSELSLAITSRWGLDVSLPAARRRTAEAAAVGRDLTVAAVAYRLRLRIAITRARPDKRVSIRRMDAATTNMDRLVKQACVIPGGGGAPARNAQR